MNAPMYMPQPSYPTPSAPGGGSGAPYPPPGGVPVYPPTNNTPYPSAGAPPYGGGSYNGGGGSSAPPPTSYQHASYSPALHQQGITNSTSVKVRSYKKEFISCDLCKVCCWQSCNVQKMNAYHELNFQ